ncbi:ligand-binding sensor domain-containing protein [Xanthocytophaga flava]|uniref:ligand-binding sensor domain-containing protein n=1 Tax=Xanthocytophaga flava TaxID=3048013 RepID=UPI0028D28D17|nr:two-component regulator propeller domain-containing protein [Xanthocytophaga flavus]MDJ1473118.1 two-component regulator propeller domain-containing protein [Xanthocytophaga flavus]
MSFKRYTVKEGLSHNYIREILQDQDGFIWIATEDGLNKFNGYTFHPYRQSTGNSVVPINHAIMALSEDINGDIWIGTWGGGVYIYNKRLDNFIQLAHENTNHTISSNFIYDLYNDSRGIMWIGTGDKGLDKVDITNFKVTNYSYNPNDKQSISHNRAISIAEDQEGNLWVGTLGGGLNCLNIKTGKFKKFNHSEKDSRSLSDNNAYCVYNDHKNRLWVGTWDKGLNLLDKTTGKFTHFQYKEGNNASICNDQVWTITETKDKVLCVGTDNGLSLYNEKDSRFYNYQNDPFDIRSLSSNSIKSLYTDREGRLWIGTYNSGLNMYDKYLVQMGHYYKKIAANTITHNDISSFLEDDEGNILIGSDGGGLTIFDREMNNAMHYQYKVKKKNGIGGNKLKTILQDKKGRIWIGFWGSGLDYFDKKRKEFTHFRKAIQQDGKHLNSDNITCMAEDKDGILWLGTFGGGINTFDSESHTFTYYVPDVQDTTSVSDILIWAVLVDTHNNIWIGTSNGRLNLFDPEKKRFIKVPLVTSQETSHAIFDLFEDSKGKLWIGTGGGGIKVLDRNRHIIGTFTKANGLPSNNVNAIEEDNQGNIWVSTNQGIARITPQTKKVKVFDSNDGLQGLQFNRRASLKLASGKLLFGGNNGFNFFNPSDLLIPSAKYPVVFVDFQIFNKPVTIGDSSPLKQQISESDRIELSYQQSVFSIEYAALNYTTPEKVQYKYRLKGFVDETWQNVGDVRKVTYTNLDPGKYTFEVTTLQDDGSNGNIRSLVIVVIPPWWKTWWVRTIMLLGIFSMFITIYYLRLKNIQRANLLLEKEVRTRTEDLQLANRALVEKNQLIQEQKEEIEAQAEELIESNNEIRSINLRLEEHVDIRTADLKKTNQELDNFVYRVSHDIRAPLSSLLGLIGLMQEETNLDQLSSYLEMAQRSIYKLDGFVKDILDYSRNSRTTLDRKQIDFSILVDNIWKELEYMENASRLDIIKDYELHKPFWSDENRLRVVFRNLFSNAIKYQKIREQHPFLKIKVITDGNDAVITIEDNGIGIEKGHLDKVFGMFYRGSAQSTGSGIGLYIVKETIEKLNGFIQLHSEYGKGTSFTIRLPSIENG